MEGLYRTLAVRQLGDDFYERLPIRSLSTPPLTGLVTIPQQGGAVICEITHEMSGGVPSPTPDEIIYNGVEYVKKTDD